MSRSYLTGWKFSREHTRLSLALVGIENNGRVGVPSEKCAGGWGSDDNEIRMVAASFVRAIERFAGSLFLHFLPRFQ